MFLDLPADCGRAAHRRAFTRDRKGRIAFEGGLKIVDCLVEVSNFCANFRSHLVPPWIAVAMVNSFT